MSSGPIRMTATSIEIKVHRQVLRGTFHQADLRQRRRPIVVMLHGFTGHRMEHDFMFVQLARALNQQGIHAVCFDFRGSGESDGTFDQMLVSGEIEDAMVMMAGLSGKPGVDRSRIGLLGFSLGGLVASCVSANVTVPALALLAPTTTANLKRHARPNDEGRAVVGAHTLHERFLEDLDRLDPLGDVIQRPRPTLLVHGTSDRAVPPRVGKQYERAITRAGVPLQPEWIEGASHVFNTPPHRRRLKDIVSTFFAQTLG